MNKICIYTVSFALTVMFVAGCTDKKGEEASNLALEIAAGQLGKKAEKLQQAERYAEAAEAYKELAEKYGNTKTYNDISVKLEKSGISIADLLSSITSIRMFKLQNLIVSVKEAKGEYPAGYAINIPKDTWGNRLKYAITPNSKKYEFYVMSKGVDEKEGTDDDLYLIYKGNKGLGIKVQEEKDVKEPGKRWTSKKSGDSLLEESLKGSGGMLDMKEFMDMAGTVKMPETTMTLDEIEKEEGSQKPAARRRSGEKVISLEDLLQEKQ